MNGVMEETANSIEKILVPKIIKSLGKEKEKVECKISFPNNCFFLSYVCFIDLTFRKHDDKKEENSDDTLRLVIKKLPLNETVVDKMEMKKQFHNEILFYTKFARDNEHFPRCIYADRGSKKNTVIVMENLKIRGYELCPEMYDIPYEYVIAALNEIARLHAIGYVMKEKETEKFNKIISEIQDPRFHETGWLFDYINFIGNRPIEWLRRNNCEKEFCDRMEKYLKNGFREIVIASVKPVEPLATLCHGDFTTNNIFFRKINGNKVEAMLFDFAVILYSSPAIDISTFLYLNCSAEDRIMKFDDLYHSYHDTLINHLRDAGIEDLEKYSYEKMLADYKRRAVFGYLIAVFFLPVIHGVLSVDLDAVFNDLNACAIKIKESGGEAMTEIFGKMIIELRDSGCLDHVKN